jgi:hypothetical protein
MSNENSRVSNLWIKNTDGKPSMSATFATVAFVAATFAYVAAIFEKVGSMTIRPFDSSACTAYLIPILGLYFGRRFTDAKLAAAPAKTPAQVPKEEE